MPLYDNLWSIISSIVVHGLFERRTDSSVLVGLHKKGANYGSVLCQQIRGADNGSNLRYERNAAIFTCTAYINFLWMNFFRDQLSAKWYMLETSKIWYTELYTETLTKIPW